MGIIPLFFGYFLQLFGERSLTLRVFFATSHMDFADMRMRHKNKGYSRGRTILVIADCQHGAMEAGRFAVRNLYDSNSRIILSAGSLTRLERCRFQQVAVHNPGGFRK